MMDPVRAERRVLAVLQAAHGLLRVVSSTVEVQLPGEDSLQEDLSDADRGLQRIVDDLRNVIEAVEADERATGGEP